MLHLCRKSLYQRTVLQYHVCFLKSGDALLLLEDGVYAAENSPACVDFWADKLTNIQACVLKDDLSLRGVTSESLMPVFTQVDYTQFVQMVAKNVHIWDWK